MAKRNFDINKYREEVITTLAVLKADNRNMKETLVELRTMLKEQNGRVRKNESSISWIQGIITLGFTVFTGFIAWLFNK